MGPPGSFVELLHPQMLPLVLAFALIALASNDIGQWFGRHKLPLITGFLATGVLAGPYVLDLLDQPTTANLGFIDELSLAVIAFAAGAELYLKAMRYRLRSITWTTIGLVVATFSLGTAAMFLLAGFAPFMDSLDTPARLGVSLLGGAILVARSPSSAIAIVS